MSQVRYFIKKVDGVLPFLTESQKVFFFFFYLFTCAYVLPKILIASFLCSHETQTTCWDHPKMTDLFQSLGECIS